jgi:hypothetical protein
MVDVAGDVIALGAPYLDGGVSPAESTPQAGMYVEGAAPVYYCHRAKVIATGLYATWRHTASDPTGAASGYPPGALTDIVVLSVA